MSIESSDAIVIKTVDFSESSLILTLWTRSFGKIHGIAKGGKRLKNPFESALDLLAQISVSFIRKNSDALDLLTEAKLARRFLPTAEHLDGLYAGYYLAELLDAMTEDGYAQTELYDLAADSLAAFESEPRTAEYLCRFEWGLLTLSGQRPSTRFCVECGQELPLEALAAAGRRLSFGFLDGGVICDPCRRRRGFEQVASVSAQSVAWLDRLDLKKAPPSFTDGEKKVRGDIRGLLNYYFCCILGKKPKMQHWIK